MAQKVIKIGSSAAVTIPKKSLEELGLKVGDQVVLQVDRDRRAVFIEPFEKPVGKDVVHWTKEFIKRYRPALEALAKR